MFFILGSPRSGTTLLSHCLGAHPDIVVPDETDFIVPAAFIFDRIADRSIRVTILKPLITRSAAFARSLGEYLGVDDVEAIVEQHGGSLRELLEALYSAVATRGGGQIAGDKSPNDLQFLRMIIKMGGIDEPIRVLHIVRDVRDVIASLMQRNWVAGIEYQYPRVWSAQNVYLHLLMGDSPRYLLVRYEELVRDPKTEMTRILRHLGREFVPAVLEEAMRNPRHRENPHHRRLYSAIGTSAIGSYRAQLSPEVLESCQEQAAEGMARFGYV